MRHNITSSWESKCKKKHLKRSAPPCRKSETQRTLEKRGKLGEIKTRGAPERNESIDDQQVITHVLALISPKIRPQNMAKNAGQKFQKVAQNYRIKKMKKQSRYNWTDSDSKQRQQEVARKTSETWAQKSLKQQPISDILQIQKNPLLLHIQS